LWYSNYGVYLVSLARNRAESPEFID